MAEEAGAVTAEPGTTETVEPSASEIETLLADQGLTDVSESDLRGEDAIPADAKVETKEPAEAETEEEKTEPPPPKPEPPPKGFVPTAAIREAREENRQLKERIKVLEAAKVESTKPEPPPLPKDEFKVLSKEEFRELSEESPREALVYVMELNEYKEAQREEAQKLSEKQRREQEVEDLLNDSVKLMSEAVPGLFDEGSTVQQELAEFAESVGFTKDMFYLTNPETMIILPGETEPVYLGTQAASIITMLAEMRKKSTGKPGSSEALRKQIEQEVLKKIKTKGSATFTSLDDIPTSEAETPAPKGHLTEAQYAKLSPAEQRAYLSGI